MGTSASSQHQQDFSFQSMLQKDLAREQIKETQGHFLALTRMCFPACLSTASPQTVCLWHLSYVPLTMATRISECAFVQWLLHLHLLPSFWINRLCPLLLVGSRTLMQSPRGRVACCQKQGLIRQATDTSGLGKDCNFSLVTGQIRFISKANIGLPCYLKP